MGQRTYANALSSFRAKTEGSVVERIDGIFWIDENKEGVVTCNGTNIEKCSNTEDSNDAPQPTNQATGTILEASETGNQLPMMAVDTTSTKQAKGTVDELPIKPNIYTSSATSQLIDQLSIKAEDTVPETDKNDNQVPVKAKDTVSADKEYGKHCSIKPAAAVSTTVEND